MCNKNKLNTDNVKVYLVALSKYLLSHFILYYTSFYLLTAVHFILFTYLSISLSLSFSGRVFYQNVRNSVFALEVWCIRSWWWRDYPFQQWPMTFFLKRFVISFKKCAYVLVHMFKNTNENNLARSLNTCDCSCQAVLLFTQYTLRGHQP